LFHCEDKCKNGEGVTELFDEVINRARIDNTKIAYIKKFLAMDKDILSTGKK